MSRDTSKQRLTDEVRRLVELVALLEPGVEVDDLAEQVQKAADAVAELPMLPRLAGEPLEERSPFSGRLNPLAPPMDIRAGETTTATATWTAPYEGPQDTLHGGYVAAAFDDLLGVAQMASGTAGFTGTLTVKFRRPTPLHEEIRYEAGVKDVRGRKITCWGKSYAGDVLVAEAEGLFVAPKDREVR